ncbi:hypothetical protein J5N97_013005 [Dioscorea zingiberensis]|uniref:ABC transporter domain-containing protein n=1 Tax=Dioscorea zingiberensis TaxID=325984 RepID=A0A9D5CQ44_9LILI|nr:hypothetical protein J5N97_013005 [Dioscorea zingiberensis]
MGDLRLDLESAVLSTTSDSPNDSASSSFSFYQSSPPDSIRASSPSFKLSINKLSYTIQPKTTTLSTFCHYTKTKLRPVKVINSASFTATSSEILAIVGPSGAGKSTLLRILSGRIKLSDFDAGSISLSGRPIRSPDQLRKISGFVTQEDNLLPLLTIKETLMFSAMFRLKELSLKEKEERVESLMQELGLLHIANSYIGDQETRGISGGERKRVSIGVDVIHDPPILLLDEPTSGLDSTSAINVLELLASMAKTRRQVLILTIHQPSYRMLRYIPNFLLLSHGTVAHCGTLRSLEETISRLGFKIPARLNTLEFAMEITKQLEDYALKHNASVDNSEHWTRVGAIQVLKGNGETKMNHDYCSRIDEITTLSWRFWKIIYRTKQLFLARTMQAIVGGLGLGSVYLNVKMDQNGVSERLGLFAFSLSFLLSSTVEALPIFLQERRVLMRECSRKMYRLSSYMLANTIIFVPFLLAVAILFAVPVYWLVGLNPSASAFMFFILVVWMIVLMASSLVLFLSAMSPDFILGNSLICMFLGIFFLFSGYFIPKDSIPKYWVFMYYVSLYRYPLDSLIINEYWSIGDKCFAWQDDDHDGSKCSLTGKDVLVARGLYGDTRWMNVGIMFGFFLIYRLLCWIVLLRKASKTML